MEIGMGSRVAINLGETWVVGTVDGMKIAKGELEKISIEEIDMWFYMSDGWKFSSEEEDKNGEV